MYDSHNLLRTLADFVVLYSDLSLLVFVRLRSACAYRQGTVTQIFCAKNEKCVKKKIRVLTFCFYKSKI